jgi:hypothetical protein
MQSGELQHDPVLPSEPPGLPGVGDEPGLVVGHGETRGVPLFGAADSGRG